MKPGDLVRYGSATPEKRTSEQKKVGLVIKDTTMMCSHGGLIPYRMGTVLVLWDGVIKKETFHDLEVISGSR